MSFHRIRPLLFLLDPEDVHRLTLTLLAAAQRMPPVLSLLRQMLTVEDPRLRMERLGLSFSNPLGLAAGYDKNAQALRGLEALGFGHLELGTVTRDPRPGQPRPRVFRLPEQEALLNRLGFPNQGAEAVGRRMRRQLPLGCVLGVNLGAAEARAENPQREYQEALRLLLPGPDYVAVNVSSPNTPGLRALQSPERLAAILQALEEEAPRLPRLVKLSPDLQPAELEALLPTLEERAQGVIAANTTLSRPVPAPGPGGLSGPPLRQGTLQMVRFLYRRTEGRVPIVGVGGIFSAEDAWRLIAAGASLVQLYTGLVYRGPGLVAAINRGLLRRLEAHGLTRLEQAVGLEVGSR